MHFAFIPYGARTEVNRLFRDMEAQKFKLKLTKKGKKETYVWIPGQIRVLPFGVFEYVFPREFKDVVLNTLCPRLKNRHNRFHIPRLITTMFRKALKLKPVPKFKKGEKFLWSKENVAIADIGIREDEQIAEIKDMGFKGYMHEAI